MTRRVFLALLAGLGTTLVRCSSQLVLPESPQAIPSDQNQNIKLRYSFRGKAKRATTVLGAITVAGLNPQTKTFPGLGVFVQTIGGQTQPWRIDVNRKWFGQDAVSKQLRKGDRWGCFPGS